jgi:hypothetical protein
MMGRIGSAPHPPSEDGGRTRLASLWIRGPLCRRGRPDGELLTRALDASGGGCGVDVVPWVAIAGSHAVLLVMTACRCRSTAAAIRVCAWVAVSLLCSRLTGTSWGSDVQLDLWPLPS